MTKFANGSKNAVTTFDLMIYGKVAKAYIFTDRHITSQRMSPGAIRGALKRLKLAGYVVFVPSLNGHMTNKNYLLHLKDEDE